MPWSLRAIAAGKHVLCEKPIGLSVAEAEQLADVAAAHPQLKVMEAFMYRFHPQWQTARKLVHDGRIGELRTIHTDFSYFNDDPHNIRNQLEMGGGALMDIGCYPISLSRFIFDAEPTRVLGADRARSEDASRLPHFGGFGIRRGHSTFTCGTQLVPYQRVNIFGTTGRIEIEIPFNAPPDRPCRMWLQTSGEFGRQDRRDSLRRVRPIHAAGRCVRPGDSGGSAGAHAAGRCRCEYAGDRAGVRQCGNERLGVMEYSRSERQNPLAERAEYTADLDLFPPSAGQSGPLNRDPNMSS